MKIYDTIKLGHAVQCLRLRPWKRMTQKQLADALGVSQGTVTFWETGRLKIPEKRISQICGVLEVSREELDRMTR